MGAPFPSNDQTKPPREHRTRARVRRWDTLRFVAVALVAAAAVGCKDDGSERDATSRAVEPRENVGPGKFAFVTNNSSDFWNIGEKGLRKAEKSLGVEVEMFRPLKGEVADQQRYLEDILVTGFDGMAISPINPAAMTEVLNEVAAKMPVITTDSDAPKSNRVSYVGTNNVAAGRAAAEAGLEALRKAGRVQGKVALFVGRVDMQNSIERRKGVEEVLGKVEGLETLPVFFDNTDRAKAKQNIEDALRRYPDLVLVIALWSYNGPIIARAVRESLRQDKPVIVAFDEEDEILEAIEGGEVYATIVQKPFEFGYQSIRLLQEAHAGREVPEVYDTGIEKVTKENVAAFWKELKNLKR